MAQSVDRKDPDNATTGTSDPGEAIKLDAFVVTGSNIRRVDAETALPVTVIDASDIELRGVMTMAELFETLPIAEPSVMSEDDTGQPQPSRFGMHWAIRTTSPSSMTTGSSDTFSESIP